MAPLMSLRGGSQFAFINLYISQGLSAFHNHAGVPSRSARRTMEVGVRIENA